MPMVMYTSPPQRAYILDGSYIRMRESENANKRTQDLEQMYYDPGQFYGYNTKSFLDLKGQIWEDIVPLFVLEAEVQDIDTENDWRIAELKLSGNARKKGDLLIRIKFIYKLSRNILFFDISGKK